MGEMGDDYVERERELLEPFKIFRIYKTKTWNSRYIPRNVIYLCSLRMVLHRTKNISTYDFQWTKQSSSQVLLRSYLI
jgi:hypothetical protein